MALKIITLPKDSLSRLKTSLLTENKITITHGSKRSWPTKKQYAALLEDSRWKRRRFKIIVRDNCRCQHCGCAEDLHVHHIVYTTFYPWNEPSMHLITLCYKCHKKEHERKNNE